jgi:PAS domain S-box-containing protein
MNKAKVARRRARNFKTSPGGSVGDLTSATMRVNSPRTSAEKKIDSTSHSPPDRPRLNSPYKTRDNHSRSHPDKRELDRAVQRYADLYDLAPTGYVSLNRSGRIEEINLTAAQLFGIPRERLIGMPFMVFVAREDTELFLHHLLRCRCSDTRVETELRLKNTAREIIYAQICSTPISASLSNGAVLFQTSIVDFTERKRFEQEIQRSEKRYHTLFDLVPVAIYVCDADGVILEYNQRAVELWGCEPSLNGEQPKFCGSYKIYYPDGRPMPHEECPMARALRGEKLTPKDLEIVVERPGGERRHVIPAPSLLTDERGRITGAINCLFDITDHKRAETAAMRLAAVVQSSHDAIAAKTVDGIITDWNQGAQRIFGYKPEEIIGKSVLTLIPKERQSEEQEILRTIRRGKSLDHYETVRRRKDGKLIDVSLTISPIRGPKGEIVGVSKIARDITKQKQAERRLAEQARLLDLSTDAIIVRDRQDRIIYWNRGAKEIYGYSCEEAIGNVTHELLRTEHSEPLKRILQRLYRNNRWSGELVHARKDGTKIIMSSRWALDRDAKGKPAFVLETNTDITERKRATEKLREREEHLRAVINQSNAGMANCDLNGRILFANRKLCKMLGYSEPELARKTIFAITHPDDVDVTRQRFAKMIRRRRPVELEKRYVRKDGSYIWASVCDTPVLDAEGKPVSAVAVAIDITQRKKAEAALQKSKGLLEKLVQRRTKALRIANSELKNEIQRRKGLEGEILAVSDREQQRLGQELHDGLCQHLTAVAFMARSAAVRLEKHRVIDVTDIEKIADLVNKAATDTRNLSQALHRADIDAAGLADALEDLVDREIWRIPCRLEVKPSFHIDDDMAAAHLYRIAREAVINANKHSEAREIVIRLERSREGMALHIIDDGVGFSDDPKVKKGLGLHIMNYRAQLTGGRLEIDSSKRGGTRVSCFLSDNTRRPTTSPEQGNGAQKRFHARIAKVMATVI